MWSILPAWMAYTNLCFADKMFVYAGYEVELSGQDSAANALVFAYTVQDGHETAALEVTSSFALNGTVRLNAT